MKILFYEEFAAYCEQNNFTTYQEKSQALYDLIAKKCEYRPYYEMENGDSCDQYRVISPCGNCIIQASKYPGGAVSIVLQGLTNIDPKLQDHVYYHKTDDKFLGYFEKLF